MRDTGLNRYAQYAYQFPTAMLQDQLAQFASRGLSPAQITAVVDAGKTASTNSGDASLQKFWTDLGQYSMEQGSSMSGGTVQTTMSYGTTPGMTPGTAPVVSNRRLQLDPRIIRAVADAEIQARASIQREGGSWHVTGITTGDEAGFWDLVQELGGTEEATGEGWLVTLPSDQAASLRVKRIQNEFPYARVVQAGAESNQRTADTTQEFASEVTFSAGSDPLKVTVEMWLDQNQKREWWTSDEEYAGMGPAPAGVWNYHLVTPQTEEDGENRELGVVLYHLQRVLEKIGTEEALDVAAQLADYGLGRTGSRLQRTAAFDPGKFDKAEDAKETDWFDDPPSDLAGWFVWVVPGGANLSAIANSVKIENSLVKFGADTIFNWAAIPGLDGEAIDAVLFQGLDAEGEPTPAGNAVAELAAALEDYPVLDDEAYSRLQHEMAIESIERNFPNWDSLQDEDESDLANKVYQWLWDNDQLALEPDTDGTISVADNAIENAVRSLGYKDDDELESEGEKAATATFPKRSTQETEIELPDRDMTLLVKWTLDPGEPEGRRTYSSGGEPAIPASAEVASLAFYDHVGNKEIPIKWSDLSKAEQEEVERVLDNEVDTWEPAYPEPPERDE